MRGPPRPWSEERALPPLLLTVPLAVLLPACATDHGREHSGRVDLDGASFGSIQVPGMVTVERSKRDRAVTCGKADARTVQFTQSAKFTRVTLGNLLIRQTVRHHRRAASGVNHRYDSQVLIVLLSPVGPHSPMASAHPQQGLSMP